MLFSHCQNVTDHFPCLPNFLLLNAKSKSWSRTDEICPHNRHVKLKNNPSGRERLWDTAINFLCPGLFITSPDHLDDVRSWKSMLHLIAVWAKIVSQHVKTTTTTAIPELFGLEDRCLVVTVTSLTNHTNSLLNCDVTGGNGSFQQRHTASCWAIDAKSSQWTVVSGWKVSAYIILG